ncbi:UNVERIFIED_CONTAM: hypothetical protein HDU68_008957 [Siphonaria sp. JEL0065]|nr:hypothetical protein HDU68_008957 [Siphonaria sp. JEL0065]
MSASTTASIESLPAANDSDQTILLIILLTIGSGFAIALVLLLLHLLKNRLATRKRVGDVESHQPIHSPKGSNTSSSSLDTVPVRGQAPQVVYCNDSYDTQTTCIKAVADEYPEEFFTETSSINDSDCGGGTCSPISSFKEASRLLKQRCCASCARHEGRIGLGIYVLE